MNCCRIVGLRHSVNPALIHINIGLHGSNRQRGSWGAYQQTVIEGGSFPPRKPYELGIHEITQPEILYLAQGMTLRHGQFDVLYGNRKVVQFFITPGHVEDEPGIHAA
jgi:hypothetical protein